MTPNDSQPPLPEEAMMLAADYVLGELTPEEEERLEQMATEVPALRREISALQTTLAFVPHSLPTVTPPDSLKEKILSSMAASAQTSVAASHAATSTVAPLPIAERNARGGKSVLKILAGIATLIAILLGADNWRLRGQLQIAQQVDPEQVAAILRQPNSRLIALQSTDSVNGTEQAEDPLDGLESAAGTLLFTPGNWQEVIVSLGDLPPLPPEEVYRMWLALDNGEVIYCGEFNAGDDGSVYVRFTPSDTPPKGVKTTELFVTVEEENTAFEPSGRRVMAGSI